MSDEKDGESEDEEAGGGNLDDVLVDGAASVVRNALSSGFVRTRSGISSTIEEKVSLWSIRLQRHRHYECERIFFLINLWKNSKNVAQTFVL